MAVLKFDETGERYYENGVDHCVLFVANADGSFYTTPSSGDPVPVKGVAWNGITNITLTPEGAEPNDLYADNIKYATLMSAEKLNASIEAYQSPAEFDVCDGQEELVASSGVTIGQQSRRHFAFAFRTNKGNDSGTIKHVIHIVYGCVASPSEKAYETINGSPDAITLSWDVTTTPINATINGTTKVTALLEIDEETCAKYTQIEEALYGKGTTAGTNDSAYQSPDDIIEILNAN